MKNWPKIIQGLQTLIGEVGSIWPKSTKLAGYAEDGPYHCEDCEYLKGLKEGNVFKDSSGKGRCIQEVMKADPDTKKDQDGLPIVNILKGCCEFVENFESNTEPEEEFGSQYKYRKP